MSTKLPKNKYEEKKKEILTGIKEGRLSTTTEAPSSSTGEFWSDLLRIKDSHGVYEPFVQCTVCHQLLSYEAKHGTNSLNLHVQNCTKKANISRSTISIDNYVKKCVTVSPDDKRTVTIACSKYCAFDMRSFNSVSGDGFRQLCQVLIDLGYKCGLAKLSKPSVDTVLPDRTNISRTVKQIANEYRSKMNEILRNDLEKVRLFGISTDYWKNSYTGDNFLTVNIHYTKDDKPVTYMLKTMLFSGTKSGENTIRTIKLILKSYDIDPEDAHIIYLTDNASNFISGLKEEVHLRCICHCLNLVVQHSLQECTNINLLITAAADLVTHFKRCELNHLLSLTLKQQCETRWNSVFDMLNSIDVNFKAIEDILLERKEYSHYLDKIDHMLLKDVTEILSFFKKGSEQLSMDQEPTLHLVLPWINKLKSYCEIKVNDSPVMKQFKTIALERIREKVWMTQLHDIATFLHPVTKNLLSYSQKERNQVHKATRNLLKTLNIVDDADGSKDVFPVAANYSNRKTSKKMKKGDLSQDDVMMEFAQENQAESDDEDEDEIDRYVKAKLIINSEESVLMWWKKWDLSFPKLSIAARSLFGIPASSCSSERIFSATGRILEERRQNLSDDIVDDMLFIRNFKKIVL